MCCEQVLNEDVEHLAQTEVPAPTALIKDIKSFKFFPRKISYDNSPLVRYSMYGVVRICRQ